jgi:hypothetical protein
VAKFGAEGSLTQETIDQLKARIKEPEIAVVAETPATPSKAAAATGAAVSKAAVTNGATPKKATPAAAAKRKPEENGSAAAAAAGSPADKKARLKDPSELRVYFEPEIMRSTKVQY